MPCVISSHWTPVCSELKHVLVIVLQGSPSPIEYRWAVLNTTGTWPEILRRYVLSRSIATMPHRLVSSKVSGAASVLASQTAHSLTPDQHLILLRSASLQVKGNLGQPVPPTI